MKKVFIATIILAIGLHPAIAQNLPVSDIQKAAKSWLSSMSISNHILIDDYQEIKIDENDVVYQFDLTPSGYIVLTNKKSLTPVIAYSLRNMYQEDGPLNDLIISDISLRIRNIGMLPDEMVGKNIAKWNELIDGEPMKYAFQQWPEPGSTTTGGWVESEWSQSSPYNDFCPLDIVNGGRSLAGCPSVAISMIINYLNTINGTMFNNSDKYYHNYGGNSYLIDDDYLTYDFASFNTINSYFDSIAQKYSDNEYLSNSEISTLVFACGVAARQVYGSGASGTFGVDQAHDSFIRFGFDNASLIYETDTSFYTQIKENIKSAMPVLLALLVTNGPGGHNVVVDGYNSDDFYHLNFGWGGSYNSWYSIPEGIPYNLTTVEGAVVDIGTKQVGFNETITGKNLSVFPNPSNGTINITYELKTESDVSLIALDNYGRVVQTLYDEVASSGSHSYTLQLETSGIYHVILTTNGNSSSVKVIIKH